MLQVDTLLTQIRNTASRRIKVSGSAIIAGEVSVQGSKNSTNKLIAVTVALPGIYELHNFPLILDPLEMLSIIETIGGTVEVKSDNVVVINTRDIQDVEIPYSLTKTTTSAFTFAGAMLGRFGHVKIGKPGGDEIGPRPIDLHSDGFRALGAIVQETGEELTAELGIFNDIHFKLRMASTGAGVNFILAVASARGKARLENAPQDGDMQAMFALLRQAGVDISDDNGTLFIDATNSAISNDPIVFTCWPDRNDAFTWLAYGALSKDGLLVKDMLMSDMQIGIDALRKIGVQIIQKSETSVFVRASAESTTRYNEMIVAGLAREFHSDWAPLLDVVATSVHGHVRIIDTLFSDRVRQAELLKQMGADITISGGEVPDGVSLYFRADPYSARYIVDINGPSKLSAIETSIGYDLRACAAMIMAASQAEGDSVFSDVNALYRGYENIIERLRSIGVNIEIL